MLSFIHSDTQKLDDDTTRLGKQLYSELGGNAQDLEADAITVEVQKVESKETAPIILGVPEVPFIPGDRVCLRGTGVEYTLTETYDHYMGRDSNLVRTYERWAKLQTLDGKPAFWKLQQLELIKND